MAVRSIRIGDPAPLTLESKHTNQRASFTRWGEYCVVGASVRGRMHVHNKVPRDDAFAVYSDSTRLAVAVSDGVGSRPWSRYGAARAVNALCTHLVRVTGQSEACANADDTLLSGFSHARSDLQKFAVENEVRLEELHCTLLGLLFDAETGELTVGQIGDGLTLGLNAGGHAVLLLDAPVPEELGATYVLTQANWEDCLCLRRIPAIDASGLKTLYLMTDGVADDCQHGPPADILQQWAIDMNREIRLLPNLRQTAGRLRSYLATYEAKGSFDDRTLVVIFRGEG